MEKALQENTFEMKPLAGTPLDYAQRENWMIRGDNGSIDHDVDVFFLYPTSVSATVKTDVCESIDDMRKNAHISYLQAADTLSSFTNMYAPYYRQVSFAGVLKNPTADALLETVYNNVTRTDVYAALDYYFEHCNKGKPYILAGHSQGSCNLKIVLSEYMRLHPGYLERMIACYAIGFYFPESWFAQNPQIKKAEGATDTGVLISWNTEGPDAKKFNLPLGENGTYCMNPLNWKTDETYADISMNPGSVSVDNNIAAEVFNLVSDKEAFEKVKKIAISAGIAKETAVQKIRTIVRKETAGVADARIDLKRGSLVTTTYTAFIPDNPVFGDKSCHFEDWALFSLNIRENAKARIAAFLGREGK